MQRCALALFAALCLTGCPGSEKPDPPEGWSSAFSTTDLGWLLSTWGPAGDRLFAVGGLPDDGRAVVFDGVDAEPLALPAGTPRLNWAFGFSASEVWMVGQGGTVLRYDGSGFTLEPTPTEEELWGIWGASPDELWAVGGRGRAEGQATLLRRSGGVWEAVELPDLERPGVNAFFKVWGSAANDVIVVGQRGALLRYDGASWTEIGIGTAQDLVAVWGLGPNDVTVVGGRGNGVAAHWDGADWTLHELAPAPGLNGVWYDAPGDVWVAGESGTLARLDPSTGELSYEQPPLQGAERTADFHALFGAGGRMLAVGGNFSQTNGPFLGLAFTRRLP